MRSLDPNRPKDRVDGKSGKFEEEKDSSSIFPEFSFLMGLNIVSENGINRTLNECLKKVLTGSDLILKGIPRPFLERRANWELESGMTSLDAKQNSIPVQ
jgi:hypothetical protein